MKRDYYGKEYYNSSTGKFSSFFERLFRLNHIKNARYIHSHFPSHRILEVGCGRGYLLKELKNLGSSVFCLESAEAAEWLLNNPDITIATPPDKHINRWPYENDFFQLIIFWHSLEHLPDPEASLEQACRCLEPGGTLCVSVPNVSSLQARMHLTTWFHLDVPRHLFHFSRKGLIALLKKKGYQIIQVVPGDRTQNLFGWLQSTANFFTPEHINSLYRLLQGGRPLQNVNKISLLIQIITSFLWVPVGICGLLIEEISRSYGTITVYAKKPGRVVC
jgi:SAM-dependent methyltransferase